MVLEISGVSNKKVGDGVWQKFYKEEDKGGITDT
jgi:hypothetical protein